MNKYKMFFIEALTNMHVGSGDVHYSVVDNMIQRNSVSQVPVIHSSSLKGALRDHFKDKYGEKSDEIRILFGDQTKDEDNKPLKLGPGRLIFFEANLLLLPLRASNRVFYYCTSPSVINEYIDHLKQFAYPSENFDTISNWLKGLTFDDNKYFYTFDNTRYSPEIEDYKSSAKGNITEPVAKEFQKLFQIDDIHDLAIFNDNYFKEICENSLPVIARNHLEDGRSVNLFYEEILPRRTKLYFILGKENVQDGKIKKKLEPAYNKFIEDLTDEKEIVQVGGNYSVGYGFSKVTELDINQRSI